MKIIIASLMCFGLFTFSGCEWKDSASAKWLGLSPSKTVPQAKFGTPTDSGGQVCPDGKPAKGFKLACGGKWDFVVRRDTSQQAINNCEFSWTVQTCEQRGMKTLKTPVCYGVTAMDLGATTATAEQCASKFGTPPKEISSILYCCE
jgi:hypothetical protein